MGMLYVPPSQPDRYRYDLLSLGGSVSRGKILIQSSGERSDEGNEREERRRQKKKQRQDRRRQRRRKK